MDDTCDCPHGSSEHDMPDTKSFLVRVDVELVSAPPAVVVLFWCHVAPYLVVESSNPEQCSVGCYLVVNVPDGRD